MSDRPHTLIERIGHVVVFRLVCTSDEKAARAIDLLHEGTALRGGEVRVTFPNVTIREDDQ